MKLCKITWDGGGLTAKSHKDTLGYNKVFYISIVLLIP